MLNANFVVHCLAWGGSFLLIAGSLWMFRQTKGNRKWLAAAVFLFGCVYCAAAVDALRIEPTALVVRETEIITPKITKPVKIVFCTDLQTDIIGNYETFTLQKIKEQNADLILFGGDYIQARTEADEQRLVKEMNQLLKEADLHAPLGIFAVRGNQEWYPYWNELFTETGIQCADRTITKDIGEVILTFLSVEDSATKRSVPDAERNGRFRIILGHLPVFAAAPQDADLLLAGHTHGGQVQIPGYGALITASGREFPRQWASGMTKMTNGGLLIVSNGSGLERGKAPRIRFWCRPDIWVIRLTPAGE